MPEMENWTWKKGRKIQPALNLLWAPRKMDTFFSALQTSSAVHPCPVCWKGLGESARPGFATLGTLHWGQVIKCLKVRQRYRPNERLGKEKRNLHYDFLCFWVGANVREELDSWKLILFKRLEFIFLPSSYWTNLCTGHWFYFLHSLLDNTKWMFWSASFTTAFDFWWQTKPSAL